MNLCMEKVKIQELVEEVCIRNYAVSQAMMMLLIEGVHEEH